MVKIHNEATAASAVAAPAIFSFGFLRDFVNGLLIAVSEEIFEAIEQNYIVSTRIFLDSVTCWATRVNHKTNRK